MVSSPRVGRVAISAPFNRANTDTRDYWNGDSWQNIEYWAVAGLLRYGLTNDAVTLAKDIVWRTASETFATGNLWERFSQLGQGRGSTQYGWSGMAWKIALDSGMAT